MKDGIENYFKRFGKVKLFLFIKPKFGNLEYCFIQFETTEGAKAALTNKNHRIGNFTVRVQPAHFHHQPDSKECGENLYDRCDYCRNDYYNYYFNGDDDDFVADRD